MPDLFRACAVRICTLTKRGFYLLICFAAFLGDHTTLTLEEFKILAYTEMLKAHETEKAKFDAAFDMLDHNKDGRIDIEEFRYVIPCEPQIERTYIATCAQRRLKSVCASAQPN